MKAVGRQSKRFGPMTTVTCMVVTPVNADGGTRYLLLGCQLEYAWLRSPAAIAVRPKLVLLQLLVLSAYCNLAVRLASRAKQRFTVTPFISRGFSTRAE